MSHSQIHAGLALGCTALAAVLVAVLPPVPPASAQSQAQRICREQGIKPASEAWEYCLSQATRSLEYGEPQMAVTYAQVAAESRDACLSYGLAPGSAGLRACIDKETTARAILVFASEKIDYGPQIAGQQWTLP